MFHLELSDWGLLIMVVAVGGSVLFIVLSALLHVLLPLLQGLLTVVLLPFIAIVNLFRRFFGGRSSLPRPPQWWRR